MNSMAKNTYPQVVWRNGQRRLWNPIHRKPLQNQPEERVRLRIIECLLRTGWSKHRITNEEAIGNLADKERRTDIICYTQEFEPSILIECKAEHIPITEKTARQVARYNQSVSARYLMMTNGKVDYWYKITEGESHHIDKKPDILRENKPSLYDFESWCQRGFAGKKANPPLRKWLSAFLPSLWHQEPQLPIQFLSFSQELNGLDLSHYYVLNEQSSELRLATTAVGTAYGGSRLIVILSKRGENKAVLVVNLDLVFDGQSTNTEIYSDRGQEAIDIRLEVGLDE